MQYVFSLSTRMLAIMGLCVFLLCVLLFLLGIEIGKRMVEPMRPAAAAPAAVAPLGAEPAAATPAMNNQASAPATVKP